MTEAEWMVCDNPARMLDVLSKTSSVRKWRLFAIESCHLVLKVFHYPDLEDAVAFGSTMTDGDDKVDWSIFDLIREDVDWGLGEMCESLNNIAKAVEVTIQPRIWSADDGRCVVESISAAYQVAVVGSNGDEEYSHQAALLREIFGNPFRPIICNPAWRTTDVMLLAQGIYDAKAFDRMPILADALQDAGCDNPAILSHCRDTSLTHVRGCWVVDLVLEKE